MGKPQATGLSPKHWKALELIEEGRFSIKEIAKAVGWSESTLYNLYEGNTQNMGTTAELFVSELQKIQERNSAKIKSYTKENKTLILRKMNEYLRSIQKKRTNVKTIEKLSAVLNAMSKTTPAVEIGSFSVTRGLSAEDLINEFKRLKSVARAAIDGGRISGPSARDAGVLCPPAVGRSPVPKKP